jgi:outer membrane immunogenic protein
MRMFRLAFVFAAGAAMLAPLSQLASAADLGGSGGYKDTPYVAVPWQGFYFGGHAGGAWGNTNLHDKFDYNGDPESSSSIGSTGLIAGAQAGYNIQRGHVVFGLEGDIGYLGISASKSESYRPSSCDGYYNDGSHIHYTGADAKLCAVDGKYSVSSDLYGDLTGRLGYAADRTLFYAKGGVALLNADLKSNYSGASCKTLGTCGSGGPSTFNFDHSETMVGWTIGAGVEYALSSAWSLKAEYQHFDFGSMSSSYKGCVSVGGNCPVGNALPDHFTSSINGKSDVSVTADAVKLGVNYHVGGEGGLK